MDETPKTFDELREACPEYSQTLCSRKTDEYGAYPWCLEDKCPYWYWITATGGNKPENKEAGVWK